MKIAVFGANGYIGSHLVKYIRENKDWEIYGYDIQDSFMGEKGIKYFKTDISNKANLDLDEELEQVYFFSGLTGTEVSIDRYEDYIRVNEIGILNLLHYLKERNKKPRIIFPSTRLVYKGVEGKPLKEDDEKEFRTIYASSKYNGEVYLEMFRNLYDIDYSVFRICVPYANMLGGKFSYGTIGFFMDKAMQQLPVTLYGDGRLKRTFTHVMDVCRQMIEVAIKPESNGVCFNIDGETFSLLEIASLIGEKYGVPVVKQEWPEKALLLESGDTIFDASRIRALLPGTIQYSLKEWINFNQS